ncbi:GTP cyclohydrolase [Paenibacillus sp. HN-1]|uniref:YciI family protein n=1 Tax=Paenibacillus TaxID=44249 RepID=UPI001CA94C7B|nr:MULTISPECIES: YciI family protein [Paenibacillus]MBY9077928.1 GTP cyclohydrolase [Paenibacillus sp. CGMCC 1.18879]MBY9084630.1 GTP cyclohydrolase [Paenibacillus sinensis]
MFIVLLTYTAPIERIDELLEGHRAFLRTQYDNGRFLMSGPRNPRTGGVIVAKGESREELLKVLENDPFYREGAASYELLSFDPVLHQQALGEFLGKE